MTDGQYGAALVLVFLVAGLIGWVLFWRVVAWLFP